MTEVTEKRLEMNDRVSCVRKTEGLNFHTLVNLRSNRVSSTLLYLAQTWGLEDLRGFSQVIARV